MSIVFVVIVAVVIVCAAIGIWVRHGKRRLRASFGSEYETVIREHDTSREVDRELRRRKSQHDELVLTRFSAQDREFYADSWKNLQGGFPENPVLSLSGAGQLVAEVIEARGYPGDDPQEQLALLSVEHADALPDYRAAQQISRHARADVASTPTEEMRQAMLSYHVLFAEMLAEPAASASVR